MNTPQNTHKKLIRSDRTQLKMLSQQSLSQAAQILTCGSPSPRQRPHCLTAERAEGNIQLFPTCMKTMGVSRDAPMVCTHGVHTMRVKPLTQHADISNVPTAQAQILKA